LSHGNCREPASPGQEHEDVLSGHPQLRRDDETEAEGQDRDQEQQRHGRLAALRNRGDRTEQGGDSE
jgi:hypothetical protein